MKSYRFMRGIKILTMVVAACLVFGFVIMYLWNWLMPTLFGLRTITFAQALGLLILSKLLLGGFHRHAGGRHGWKRHMEERFAQMSPEERERLRAGMRGRRGCHFGRAEEKPPQPASL